MVRSSLSRAGRILGLLCAALFAIPAIYALGSLALIYGLYALWGLVGVVLAVFEMTRSPSLGDLRAFAGIGFWISLVLMLSAGTLYGIWVAVRSFGAFALREPRAGGDLVRPGGVRRYPARWRLLLLVPPALGSAWLLLPPGRDERPKAHVTIYLDPALVASGGALVVAGVPMPEAAWRSIPAGDNPAMLDPANPKGAQAGPADRHFGAVVAGAVAVVEFRYPEGGTYTFNIRPMPGTDEALGRSLTTQSAGVGSSSEMRDPETGGEMAWPSVTLVAILGPGRDAGWTRVADSALTRAFDEGVVIRHYEGVRTLSLSGDQVWRFVDRSRNREDGAPDGG